MKSLSSIRYVVVGSLNTDVIFTDFDELPAKGSLVTGKVRIGPGGKSRNVATMIATLTKKNVAAMVGRTCQDRYGLWKPPVAQLKKAGVNADFVKFAPPTSEHELPGIAIIPVNKKGENRIFLDMGANLTFSPSDIKDAAPVFKAATTNKGSLIMTLELPMETAIAATKQAKEHGLTVMLDPGGIEKGADLKELLKAGIDIIKPNEHEAELLTGIAVTDLTSADKAAKKLSSFGIKQVMITAGSQGAYAFDGKKTIHIAAPQLPSRGAQDETGCGDQTMAALAVALQEQGSFHAAASYAVLAGTIQFQKIGIQPVTSKELEANRRYAKK